MDGYVRAVGVSLEHYLVARRTRCHTDTFDAAGHERLIACVAASFSSAGVLEDSAQASSTLSTLVGNGGDEAADLAVRRFDPSTRFTPARLPALLRGANHQLREVHRRNAERAHAPALSAVVLTTWFGSVRWAYVGDWVAVHRIRAGRVERLTRPISRIQIAPGMAAASPEELLGQVDVPNIHEDEEPLVADDVFMLSECPYHDQNAPLRVCEPFARTPAFDTALRECFAVTERERFPVLLVARQAR